MYVTSSLKVKPANCRPTIFNLRLELGVKNALIVAEICLVTPLSNAESEQAFSFLRRNFCKERSSMKNDSMENILRLRDNRDFSKQRYRHAINYFWRNIQMVHRWYIDRQLDGHTYPKNRKSKTTKPRNPIFAALDNGMPDDENYEVVETVKDIPLKTISDSEFSDSSDED